MQNTLNNGPMIAALYCQPIQMLDPLITMLPPTLQAAAKEAIAITQAPAALVVSAALSAASLAVQARFRVIRMNGLSSPCSIYTITFAESGERKSTVDRLFFAPFSEFERSVNKRLAEDSSSDKDEESPPPKKGKAKEKPKLRLCYSDTTPQAYLFGLSTHSASAALIEDEAGRIFTSRLINDLGLLNKLWDGRDVTVDRKSGSFEVRSPRSTISWMVQPGVFQKYMERKGTEARGIGFLARCLVCFPTSTQGTRFLNGPPPEQEQIPKLHARIMELLNGQLDIYLHKQDIAESGVDLTFSPVAQTEWQTVFNQIEAAMSPGREFSQVTDYASKVAENIARVAGILHAFEAYEGTRISPETLRSATQIVLWYAQQFVKLFAPPAPLDDFIQDAIVLEDWLVKLVQRKGMPAFLEIKFLLQYGPNALRQRDRMKWAINYLADCNRLGIQVQASPVGRYRKAGVVLNDRYFGCLSRGEILMEYFPPLDPSAVTRGRL